MQDGFPGSCRDTCRASRLNQSDADWDRLLFILAERRTCLMSAEGPLAAALLSFTCICFPPGFYLISEQSSCFVSCFHPGWTHPRSRFLYLSANRKELEKTVTFVLMSPLTLLLKRLRNSLGVICFALWDSWRPCFVSFSFRCHVLGSPGEPLSGGPTVANCGGGSSPAGISPHKDCLFCFTWTIFGCLSVFVLCFNGSFFFFLPLSIPVCLFVCVIISFLFLLSYFLPFPLSRSPLSSPCFNKRGGGGGLLLFCF